MHIIDSDLLSIQEARIAAENAKHAQVKLAEFSQAHLDTLISEVCRALIPQIKTFAEEAVEETDYGNVADKVFKTTFICEALPRQLQGMHCVGVIHHDFENCTMDIGVPKGAIASILPVFNPVETVIYQTLIALKSGNAIVFCPHPRAKNITEKVLNYMLEVLAEKGLPEGVISYMHHVLPAGMVELMHHRDIELIINTAVPELMNLAQNAGKSLIFGGMGNNPAFIEKTADFKRAAKDIVASKSFDYGTLPGAEQSLVVDADADAPFKSALKSEGAYFMQKHEADMLIHKLFYGDGSMNLEYIGKSAETLAHRAGFEVPAGTKLLIAEEQYVSKRSNYVKEIYAPVLTYYVEEDWMHACEKCIELLIGEGDGHSLVIYSNDDEVIRQFALKKPVGRMLVNTSGGFGAIGVTTNLFPAMTLGSGSAKNGGMTVDNVSPMNLVYVRKIAYGARHIENMMR